MSLAALCRTNFSWSTWQKGTDYFSRGKVVNLIVDATGVSADVRGSARKPYHVEVDWPDAKTSSKITVSCTCPYFNDGNLCKHVAAVIQEVDEDPDFRGLDLKEGRVRLIGQCDDEADWDDDDIEDDDLPAGRGRAVSAQLSNPPARRGGGKPPKSPVANWRRELATVVGQCSANAVHSSPAAHGATRPLQGQYVVSAEQCGQAGEFIVGFAQRQLRAGGAWGVARMGEFSPELLPLFESPEDRAVLELIGGLRANSRYDYGYYTGLSLRSVTSFTVMPVMFDTILPRLAATGRFGWIYGRNESFENARPLTWDGGPPWRFRLEIRPRAKPVGWELVGELIRDGVRRPLSDPVTILSRGLVMFPDHVARFEGGAWFPWIQLLRRQESVAIPANDVEAFLELLWASPLPDEVALPEELHVAEVNVPAVPGVKLVAARPGAYGNQAKNFGGRLEFHYGERTVACDDKRAAILDLPNRRLIRRDLAGEQRARHTLAESAAKAPPTSGASQYAFGSDVNFVVARPKMATLVDQLVALGWRVEAEGALIRRSGSFQVSVKSNVDWFELEAEFDFEGVKAGLPELLAALRKGEKYITLGDGTRGMLPEEWLKKYAPLTDMGSVEEGALRFRPSQAAILDALLAAQPDAQVDAGFNRVRQKLRSFDGVSPADPPKGFSGELREYQRRGLGWLHFLRDFRFGGCLADDMGLGKTIQVLSLLEARRTRRVSSGEPRAPSLVVVPKSLIHNWIDEAAHFTPKLRVRNFTGLQRGAAGDNLSEFDVVLTTYGTLRRDIIELKDQRFDYAILDEAQAIKNAGSQAAKACRLIQADHRLAMTGTPIENHLGELWSLIEFLNPGMLGRSPAAKLFSGKLRADDDGASIELLARALRPFILRRTKEQVLTELPEKTEQTLYCELEPPQRKLYDELRDHYRASLAKTIETKGLANSKIHVLEALLRLRQAACHPGLIDPKKAKHASAKLDALMEQLREVIDEGHKALVFSQFTSLLAIVRQRLNAEKIAYEYLDGQTTNRKRHVEAFQAADGPPVFLISLKAGGQGLNLTAADYVFILDPWWNPAVEAQAVDRAHRIGQARPVFAYRLIARGTVEEKILELQREKRDLAEAIITADNSLIRTLTADDLRLLLS